MDELADIMREVLNELKELNSKLDSIRGVGAYNSMADIYDKLDIINYSISDVKDEVTNVCDKLDIVDSSISSVESAVNSVESSIDSLDRY